MTRQLLEYLIIHCTASQEGREMSADTLRKMHMSPPPKGRGWKQVGYTFLIHLDGVFENLVPNNGDAYVDGWEITNGAIGYNSKSMHICYVGGIDRNGKPKDTRTDLQRTAMEAFVKDFKRAHPTVKIIGHNEVAAKACPSFDVQKWLKELRIKN